MDDTFDNVFENILAEFEIRQSIRIKQEFACQAMGKLHKLLANLPLAVGQCKYFCLFISVTAGLTTGNELLKFFYINFCCFIIDKLLFVVTTSFPM
jgi:hypothetical protein